MPANDPDLPEGEISEREIGPHLRAHQSYRKLRLYKAKQALVGHHYLCIIPDSTKLAYFNVRCMAMLARGIAYHYFACKWPVTLAWYFQEINATPPSDLPPGTVL